MRRKIKKMLQMKKKIKRFVFNFTLIATEKKNGDCKKRIFAAPFCKFRTNFIHFFTESEKNQNNLTFCNILQLYDTNCVQNQSGHQLAMI